MTEWLRWTAPVAAVMSIAAPVHAAQYMSVEEAQKHAFPNASFTEVQAGRVWKAQGGGGAVGYFYYDHVVGKHLLIDYTVAVGADGRVRRVDIHVTDANQRDAERAVEAAFSVVAEVHRLMSFHEASSDVSRLNRAASNGAVLVHPWTCAVLEMAVEMNRHSAGAFDIGVAPALQRTGQLPGVSEALPSAASMPTVEAIELLADNHVRFLHPSVLIDLGGIAKGFAVDRALEKRRARGHGECRWRSCRFRTRSSRDPHSRSAFPGQANVPDPGEQSGAGVVRAALRSLPVSGYGGYRRDRAQDPDAGTGGTRRHSMRSLVHGC